MGEDGGGGESEKQDREGEREVKRGSKTKNKGQASSAEHTCETTTITTMTTTTTTIATTNPGCLGERFFFWGLLLALQTNKPTTTTKGATGKWREGG